MVICIKMIFAPGRWESWLTFLCCWHESDGERT